MVFYEYSVYRTRVHNLFDGPRMRYQSTRVYRARPACGVHNWTGNSEWHVKLVRIGYIGNAGPALGSNLSGGG